MTTVEDFILQHADARFYDPRKAHEYYLRTRQLKGRKKAAFKPASGNGQRAEFSGAQMAKKPPAIKSAAERQKAIEDRVGLLKIRLEKLREELKRLVAQAQRRSGETPKKQETSKKPSSDKPEKLTAAQKKDAAKRSEEYRKKHPEKESASDQVKALEADIARVEKQIGEAQAKLKDSVKKARFTLSQPRAAA